MNDYKNLKAKTCDLFFSESEKETIKIAKQFAKTLKSGDIVALYGDLGAGKTVFAKGVISLFSKDVVTSPTFTILNEYANKIYHFDMYRLEDENELENLGYEDYMFGDGICLIEWPERVLGILPKNIIRVTITKCENGREIKIER